MNDLGIIGFGIMGERLACAAVAHEDWRLTAAWDPDPGAAARLAAIAPEARFCATMEEAIAASDALHVASPPGAHIGQGRAVLEAGRALLMEKPLSHDVAASQDFVRWAAGYPAAVNFPMASSPSVAQLRAWLPELGEVRSVSILVAFAAWPRSWQRGAAFWLAGRAEGGFTREVASHFLFLAGRLFGKLSLLEGRAVHPDGDGAEAAVAARLCAGRVPVTLQGSVGTTAADDHNLFVVRGENGEVRLRDWSIAERLVDGAWQEAPDARPNAEMRPLTLRGQLDKLAALRRGEATALATLEEALAVQEAVEAILKG
ncbi:Gfo/Idh/MocA family protein [Sabulicella glaciei]|uniref:Gfo/Idh/MocA family oxidoreductase n=1 Tax=Sabulicella glaciei TaxID=2984948 RepID=A0ABT3NY93_9PROT|nr:Gfo/Idh/MocA family oxidoreductase [Roseococcus sp. MDT2-1-1]MCW8087137.1 Gfo/Idh/MocA family oxidoreductase [Roseococcus sp. MDT2-1-1]